MSADDLRDAATAQHWITEAFRVITLDELWTQALARPQLDVPEMDEVASIGQSLRDAWLRLTDGYTLMWQRDFVSHRIARLQGDPTANNEDLIRLLRDLGEPEQAVETTFADLIRVSDAQAEELDRKVAYLSKHTWVAGDLWQQSLCLVYVAAILTAFALGSPLIAGGILTWAVGAGCPKLLMPRGGEAGG